VPEITSPHALLAFKVSVEKSGVILMGLPLYVICFFSLTAFSILSLFSMLVVLMIICCGEVLLWSSLFDVCRLPVPEWAKLLEIWEIFCYYFIEYI
jgi:hypothetical protein